MKPNITFFLLFFVFQNFLFAQSPFVHFPALSPDGSKIAFSYQGDIWTMPSTGGKATRLTVHEAYETSPKWSPDGKQIAFEGERFGNMDIFVIDAENGNPKRLTFRSNADRIGDWASNKQILFSSSREFRQAERETEIFTINAEGGTEQRFLDALGTTPVASPSGRFVAFVRGYCPANRPAYVGAANLDIWLFDQTNKKYVQITNFESNDLNPDWAGEKEMYFLRATKGVYNLHKIEIETNGSPKGKATQLTDFQEDGIRNFDVSADGKKVVFERQNQIFTCDPDGKNIQAVNIQMPQDYAFDAFEVKDFNKADEFEVSPNGKLLLFGTRGELFVKENDKEKSRSVALDPTPFRETNALWLNDSTVIFASDRNGNYDLFLAKSADLKQGNLFKTLKRKTIQITDNQEDELVFQLSPDRKKIAWVQGKGKLMVGEILNEKITNPKEIMNGWDTPADISWSPDGQYLAYSLSDLYFNDDIYIAAADGSQKPVNVSMHPRGDSSPKWSADGSKLAFLSERNNGDANIWFVWLRKTDWERTKQDWEDLKSEEKKEEKKDDKKKKTVKVEIDFENIHDRLAQVTSLPAGESELLISQDGETFYFVSNENSRQSYKADRDLYSIRWDGTEMKALTSGGQNPNRLRISEDGKNIYGLKEGRILKYDAKDGKSEARPFTAQIKINYLAERKQVFWEAWRTLDRGFYDPNFHGQNWTKLGQKYEKWALSAVSEQDYTNMVNEMLGQLNASHMGFRHSDRAETQTESTGLLGIEIKTTAKGWEIMRVVSSSPADRKESKLNENDQILSINGENFDAKSNFYSFFNKKATEQTLLEVQNAKGEKREVIIRPTTASVLSDLLYEEWVADRKKLVEKFSNGKLGYIHIRGMDWVSFERFEREVMASGYGKEGLLIDVRNNGGGWTTDYLMHCLTVKQHAYTIPRGAAKDLEKEKTNFKKYYPNSERLPFAVVNVPTIALCNEFSYSNAEIFSHAYKVFKLGKLVGKTTFGAVISTGGNNLMDGSFVRLPGRGWYGVETNQDMEVKGAVPDVELDNTPDAKAQNQDQQLQKAVELLLEQVKK